MLTPADTSYWAAIRGFSAHRRRMPSYGEIMELVGFRSRHAVYCLVQRLVAEGLVTKDAQGKLIPTNSANGIPLLGIVEAGWPSPAEEGRAGGNVRYHPIFPISLLNAKLPSRGSKMRISY